ncbi:hypothetical protein SOPP22_08700 [Shewanella sp. OPT22]|nr:hypothetical protein SOPP22_08700 [Shewanella sp. OPT22]
MLKHELYKFYAAELPTESQIISNWFIESNKPKVSFVCMAFNHESYIEETIRGFLLQKTTFPFEIIIHDDASTDKTSEIIKNYQSKYPSIISSIIQEENKYSLDRHFPLMELFSLAKGEYVSICEGDDFWFCEQKVSNQVEILDSNESIGLVYSKASIYHDSRKEYIGHVGNYMCDNRIYTRNGIPTLTTMFRKKLLSGFYEYVGEKQRDWLHSDYQLWLWLNLNSEIYFENRNTSIYRVLDSSASRPIDINAQYNYRLSVLSTSLFFASKNLPKNAYEKVMFKNHLFLYLWCLKRNLKYSESHKEVVCKYSGKLKFIQRIICDLLIEKCVLPLYLMVRSK